jgi:hypothetical protein
MSHPAESNLSRAKRRVEDGRRIVAAQQTRINQKAQGSDRAHAESLLESFQRTLAIFEYQLEEAYRDER